MYVSSQKSELVGLSKMRQNIPNVHRSDTTPLTVRKSKGHVYGKLKYEVSGATKATLEVDMILNNSK